MNFKKLFEAACIKPHNIEQHLPKLYEMGCMVNSITEFGVSSGTSTLAFLYADPKKLTSIDIEEFSNVREWFNYCKELGKDYNYIIQSDLTLEIEPTDILFIDSLHTYGHLTAELQMHSSKVNKYIIFHDTVAYGHKGENGDKGLVPAIDEFLAANSNWKIIYDVEFNNGLRIIQKD